MEALYTAKARAKGGRNGHVETLDGDLKLDLSIPKTMGGPGKQGAINPEQLFACGYAACFGSAIESVAKQKRITLSDVVVIAEVSIGKKAQGSGFMLAAELKVHLPGISHEQATELVAAAHQTCPYSNATRGNMDVKLTVVNE
jgi:lipoyl-dependent peroxiredoxin